MSDRSEMLTQALHDVIDARDLDEAQWYARTAISVTTLAEYDARANAHPKQ